MHRLTIEASFSYFVLKKIEKIYIPPLSLFGRTKGFKMFDIGCGLYIQPSNYIPFLGEFNLVGCLAHETGSGLLRLKNPFKVHGKRERGRNI